MAKKSKTKDRAKEVFNTPEGMVINHSLFSLDKGPDGKWDPAYRLELAFDEDGGEALRERVLNFAAENIDGKISKLVASGALRLPLLDGDKLAKKREKNEKSGDAYKGMTVIRVKTIFDVDGEKEGDGGADVVDTDGEDLMKQSDMYRGCFAKARLEMQIVPDGWDPEDFDEDDAEDTSAAIIFYLKAVKKTGDGEKLGGGGRASALFDADEEKGSKKSKRSRDEDDDDDEPKKKSKRSRDEDDDEDEPKKKSKKKARDDDDDDEPRRASKKRKRRDEEDDDD